MAAKPSETTVFGSSGKFNDPSTSAELTSVRLRFADVLGSSSSPLPAGLELLTLAPSCTGRAAGTSYGTPALLALLRLRLSLLSLLAYFLFSRAASSARTTSGESSPLAYATSHSIFECSSVLRVECPQLQHWISTHVSSPNSRWVGAWRRCTHSIAAACSRSTTISGNF